jgi:2-(1,2-epoxy-1,2-dihydrophenyl)acetyl-CoA isomerase
MVNFVVPAAELAAETDKLARRLANGPTHALGNLKWLMNASLDNQLEQQLQMEAEAFADNVTTEDFREGIAAFVEKRKPAFKGR